MLERFPLQSRALSQTIFNVTLACLFFVLPFQVAHSQVPEAQVTPSQVSPAASNPSLTRTSGDRESGQVDSSLQEGLRYERDHRWIEALTHYDSVIREHPDEEQLRLRRTLAHIHVDLDRRLADSSFRDFQTAATENQALAQFQEICLKVQMHYVHEPNWQRLFWRGTANLDVAVTNSDFRTRFALHATDAEIRDFRKLLRNNINNRPVKSRRDARELASYTAQLAEYHLGVPRVATIGEYCAGAIASLDQYSTYLTADQLDDVYSQIEGNFVGLGIELKATDDSLLIVKVIGGGPAEQAGIRAGDRIIAVNGQSTTDISTDKAADLLKGEQGTRVSVRLATTSTPSSARRTSRSRGGRC